MNEITKCSTRTQDNFYSGQSNRPVVPLRNIEEGVRIIEKILQKDLLCRHDILEINQIYQQIDLIERKFNPLPKCNSLHALKKIAEKVNGISQNNGKDEVSDVKNLISLYHLKNFSDKNSPIEKCFNVVWQQFKKNPETFKNIATHLPGCYSETQFEEDTLFLIGDNSDKEVTKILNRKKTKLHYYAQVTESISNKKLQLLEFQETKSQDFPEYLNELLNCKYIHLYDHLIHMRTLESRNERESEILKISFSKFSLIILETRDAIIQKVENSIPEHCPNVLFLLGRSGEGKSTTLCFLRGDEMVLKNFCYESKSGQRALIGHDKNTSCTFFPNIEVINNIAIIDFPGFADTNGSLVSLGMELALIALVLKFQPKILVLESIINTAGRGEAAAKLGSRLQRLLHNKTNCTLGITKYSLDVRLKEIKELEARQKELLVPSQEENICIAQIEMLSTNLEPLIALNQVNLLPIIENQKVQIKQMQQQLEMLQKKRAMSLEMPLLENKIMLYKEQIQSDENNLLMQIGLESMIRFDNLEEPNHFTHYLKMLNEKTAIRANSQQILDPENVETINHLFVNNLSESINSIVEYDFNIENFEQSVKESSLINTIFSHSNPEIGQFLHLPEINPHIVRNYDKQIVSSCIEKYMNYVILELDILLINTILSKAPQTQKIQQIEKDLLNLQVFVLALINIDLRVKDKKDLELAWNTIRLKIQEKVNTKTDFDLPFWAKAFINPLYEIPGIRALLKWKEQQKLEQLTIQETIDQSCIDVHNMYDTLLRLKNLEKLIQKQEEIDEAFDSVQISIESSAALKETMKERIDKVRIAYGKEDWDRRVQFFVNDIIIPSFERGTVLILAYCFIESISCSDLEDKFRAINSLPKENLNIYLSWLNKGDAKNVMSGLEDRYKIKGGKIHQTLLAAALLNKEWNLSQ